MAETDKYREKRQDKSTDMYKMALNKMMAICSSKEQCRYDIRKKLEDYNLGEKEQEKLLAELERERFIDESRYARAFVNDKFKYNDWGKIKIASQLKMKQIPGNIIVEALGTIDGELYFETIKKLLEEKRRGIKAKNRFDMGAKLFRYGLSKGFESELLYKLINLSAEEE